MAKKLVVTGSTYRKIRDTSKHYRRLSARKIAAALGAEPTGIKVPKGLSPPMRLVVRQELYRQMQAQSRPISADPPRPSKIPLSDQTWSQLEEIAKNVSSPGFSPSAGQVASVLLSAYLRSLAAGSQTTSDSSKPA